LRAHSTAPEARFNGFAAYQLATVADQPTIAATCDDGKSAIERGEWAHRIERALGELKSLPTLREQARQRLTQARIERSVPLHLSRELARR
jgi:hypothetical protein